MKVIDMICHFIGQDMYFLDSHGWMARPFENSIKINSVSACNDGKTLISSDLVDIYFYGKPFKNIIVFDHHGFIISSSEEIIISNSNGECLQRGVFSFISAEYSPPYQEDDPEHIIVTMHYMLCKNFSF